MAGGYLAGALWGAVVAGLGAAAASVATGPVLAPQPEVSEAVASAPGAPPAAEPDKLPQTSLRDGGSPQTASPGIIEPDSGAEAAGDVADTASTGLPETGEASALPEAPDAGTETALATTSDAPVVPGGQGAQPTQPEADELSISNNPVQPPAPVPAVDEAAPQLGAQAPEADATADLPTAEVPIETTSADPAPAQSDTQSEPDVAADTPASPPSASDAAPQTAQAADTGALPASPTAEAAAPALTETPQAPAALPDATDLADLPATPAAEDEAPAPRIAEDTAPERPKVNALIDREDDSSRPSVGRPAGTLTDRASQVPTNRLPALTEEAPAAPQAVEEAPGNPLEKYAQPVGLDEDKPLMSIVLIDDGNTPLGLEALEAFPYPITFAIDTAWDGAAEAMRRYRDAGFEVMALANLPDGAQPQDAEVTLGTALATVPEAVAVLEGDKGGLQDSRGVSEQVAGILAESGHGLVLYPKGLNTGQALAARSGVPSATLFRDFDGKGQTATVIRRFLDQAAFKAGQEGAVIMVGRLRAETISALLIWGLQDRANRVSFVPVSTILLRDAADG